MVHPSKIPSDGGIDAYPLSPIQHGMLFHSVQGAPGVDIQQVICEMPEQVDAACFEQAWRDVVERHPVLRTGFEWSDGSAPRQVVQPMSRVRLDFHHAEFGSELEAQRGLEEYLAADRAAGFPSLSAPLLRVALLRGAATRCWFVTTYHHLIIDARSMALMFREALDRHDALLAGQPLELPAARPYRAYIEWLGTRDDAQSEGFWRNHLQGFATPTSLPVLRAADVEGSAETSCGELMFKLPAKAAADLKETAARHGVTPNTLVQAAWATVLSRYSGEEDVVFGALRACRHVPIEGVEQTLGLFINTLPVRSTARSDMPVAQWLKKLRADWLALRPHEHTALSNIQRWSDVAPGRALFDTLLNYQEPSWDASLNALGGKWAERRFDIRSRPGYPLALDVYGGATVTGKLFYERARIDDEAAARLLGHFCTVLEALAGDSVKTVGDLPLLTPREREQLLVTWNRTEFPYPQTECVHWLVEAHASVDGARIAVTDSVNALTYTELNVRANRIAHRLMRSGVGPDVRVAVCMERATEMLVAWLAVLKAGGAFVPLDPGYPAERLAYQISDCRARVLLTQPRVRAALPANVGGASIVEVAADGSGFESESDANPQPSVSAQHLAYVIYTSGSTGLPKGVQIEHRALMNLVAWHRDLYRVTPADRATHLASPAFDASVWEIWPYLATGASVHIPDDETRLSPGTLWRWMGDKRITISFMPTPLAEAALAEPRPKELSLRALLTGGDKLRRRPPQGFPCDLINHYGPTESTVVATCARVDPNESAAEAPTIGAPIGNTTAFVLDRALRPVPVGVPGELFIGGSSLARGYLGRPELDAEKFVSIAVEQGGPRVRLYRTGDLVRWTARGQLEFLGRIDGQVKIRGCRIELGEIEATLHEHTGIRESVVLARPDARGQLQLVAYVIRKTGVEGELEDAAIAFLRQKLPAYMVPAAVVTLEAWPLTPNGKIDRKALPEPTPRRAATDAASVPRLTPMEQTVASVWCDVLGRPAISAEENFFDLGGHSLIAAQVISRLNATLAAPVSVRALFDQPTLAGFAREIERRLADSAPPFLPTQRLRRRAQRAELELAQPN